VSNVVTWAAILTTQSLFPLFGASQQPLMFINMFGLMAGMQLNVMCQSCFQRSLTPRAVLVFCLLVG
jgi:hypothetical protein